MHDFDYDVLEKKRIARSARNRINGSRSTYVSLPSDHLTAAEKKNLNGECKVYSLDRVIPWHEFKRLPMDIQKKYLEFLRDKFDISSGYVGEMFGIRPSSFTNWLAEHEMKGLFPKNVNRQNGDVFRAWWQGPSEEQPVVEEKPVKKPEPRKPEMPYFPETLQVGQFTMKGTGTEISQTLFGIFRDKKIEVFLKFRAIEEVPVPEDGEETESVPCED